MARPRLVLRRLACRTAAQRVTGPAQLQRYFTLNTSRRSSSSARGRPQLPFLSSPPPRHQFRYLTTERKRWLVQEAILTTRYIAILLGMSACGWAAAFALREEYREREHPTPHDWTYVSRVLLREAHCERERPNVVETNYIRVFQLLRDTLARLESPGYDGAGLVELDDPPPLPVPTPTPAKVRGALDISTKTEEWRRGYYEVLLAAAKAAEHVDGFVVDRTRNIAFPPELVIGPSNPRPRPIPPGAASAPREENCDPAFTETADFLYQKLLATKGLTARQRMDGVLAYASWLEFKGIEGPALVMYEEAVRTALEAQMENLKQETGTKEVASRASTTKSLHSTRELLDPKTWTLSETPSSPPSANLVTSLTAYASFRARQGDVASALPMMVSILRARRLLTSPDSDAALQHGAQQVAAVTSTRPEAAPPSGVADKIADFILSWIRPPAYPPPPPDGTQPPLRDARGICEEAALHMHIGEMLYAAAPAGRDEGLAWTREAVDMAEEQLHRLMGSTRGNRTSGDGRRIPEQYEQGEAVIIGGPGAKKEAKSKCRECLASGLGNWETMVAKLARDEEAAREKSASSGGSGSSRRFGLGLWGDGGAQQQQPGRWATEKKVVEDRRRRAKELLEEEQWAPSAGFTSLFWT